MPFRLLRFNKIMLNYRTNGKTWGHTAKWQKTIFQVSVLAKGLIHPFVEVIIKNLQLHYTQTFVATSFLFDEETTSIECHT